MTPETLEILIKEVIKESPIDFGYLKVSEDELIKLLSNKLIEEYSKFENVGELLIGLYSALGHQIIQNFILNLKLMNQQKKYIDILPCPFCGKEMDSNDPDTLYPYNREKTIWNIVCQQNYGGCDAYILGDNPTNCILKWNTRKTK